MPKFDTDKLRALSILKVIVHETGKQPKPRGAHEVIQCPMHNDRPPGSLAIDENKNLWYCHGACGVGGDPIRFIELHRNLTFTEACQYLVDTFDSSAIIEGDAPKAKASSTGRGPKPKPWMPIPERALTEALPSTVKGDWWLENYGKYITAWRYHDIEGGVCYIDARFEDALKKKGKKSKSVLPLYYGKNGKWKMGIPFDIIDKPRILYNLHLLKAEGKKPVLIVEGCKCASVNYEGLRKRFILSTWPGGTNGIPKVDVRPLYGREVVIWPDGDDTNKQFERGGYKAAYYLAEKLKDKSEVKILRAAEHPKGEETKHGYDIADYIDDGGNPLEYIDGLDNSISVETARDLAGLLPPDADESPDFRDSRKFSMLDVPTGDTVLNILGVLDRNDKGSVLKNDGNFLHITEHDPDFRYLIAYDTAINQLQHSDKYAELDELDNSIWQYCQRNYEIAPTKTQRTDMVKSIAYRNSYNSLEVFLDELKLEIFGDAVPEFDKPPLIEILEYISFSPEENYPDTLEIREYYTELFHKYFLRMFIKLEYIIRGEMDMIPPGDIVPILEGDQGLGKTRFCLFLSIEPQKYYVDMAELQLTTSRDTIAKIRGKLIGELGELAGLKRTELETIKAFISSTFDEMRRLYSESTIRSPRTISFIGTTNEREYLRDTTGNRRFWPVRVDKMDADLYGKTDLIKKLYIYYRELAMKLIDEKRVQNALLISKGLQEFMLYLREEKRVQPPFIDDLLNYIYKVEAGTATKDPVRLNVNTAHANIYKLSENIPVQLPPRFMPEFNRILTTRGYTAKRGVLHGKECRYWQLDGRYCSTCRRNVPILAPMFGDVSASICEECQDKKESHTNTNAEDPF